MTKFRFLKTGAIGALATALVLTSLPAAAQDRDRGGRGGYSQRETRGGDSRPASPRSLRSSDSNRGGGNSAAPAVRAQRYTPSQPSQQAAAPAPARPERNTSYTAPRNRSYGATARTGDAGVLRQQREVEARLRPGTTGQAQAPGRQDFRRGYRAGQNADQRSDRDAYRQGYTQGRRADARDDRRDQQRAYANGYRAGDRSDNRWDNNRSRGDNRRWDNRGWRNDNRYDWQRYRASNRSLFSLGRYYSPYRGYSYSRLSIGFTLGSLFYSNRYWINDPWQYRLPPVYGPYRWVRYYDDALLVDTYTGQVVDVIYDFFW